MIHRDISRRLLAGFYVLLSLVLLMGLVHFSYRAKELLVCWLLFCSFLAVLALILLGAVLAAFAGRYFLKWLGLAKLVIPELAARFTELPQEPVSGLGILVAGTLKTPASTGAFLDALEAHSGILIEVALRPNGVSESEQTPSYTQTNISRPLQEMD